MIRLWLTLVFVCLSLPAFADEPVLTIEANEVSVIPGQSLSLRLTVLTPTNLLQPPVWPSFDTPNLLVRVASTGPMIRKIKGETWAGVSRRYLITPMTPGKFALSASNLKIIWADPKTRGPVETLLQAEPVTIFAVVPEAARDLTPFLAAKSISLEHQIEGDPAAMIPGDSLTFTVQAHIQGSSPIFLPPLLSPEQTEGLRGYPDEPVFDEQLGNRGETSGTRTEKITYVAEGGGNGRTSDVMLRWYNLDTGKIETAQSEGFSYSIEGPPIQNSQPRNWRLIILVSVLSVAGVVLILLSLRRVIAWLHIWRQNAAAKHLTSEHYAWSELRDVIAAHDLSRLGPALDKWISRLPEADIRRDPQLTSALTKIGASRYGSTAPGNEGNDWREVRKVLSELRKMSRQHPTESPLPLLNPAQTSQAKNVLQ